jgi:hypothetical protein
LPGFEFDARGLDPGVVFKMGQGHHLQIDGTLDVPAGLRLSDFVARTVGFLPARDANVRVWTDPGAQFFESVLVNPARLVGVTEPEVPR